MIISPIPMIAAAAQAPATDLRACFALSDRDRVLTFDQRGPENRLGLAVSLCALRFLGFVPDDIASVPDEALVFVAGQVDAAPHELLAYGARAQSAAITSSSPWRIWTGDAPTTATASASRSGYRSAPWSTTRRRP